MLIAYVESIYQKQYINVELGVIKVKSWLIFFLDVREDRKIFMGEVFFKLIPK